MYNTCIFDLDGTIANTLETIAYFGNKALKRFRLMEVDILKYRYLVGDGARKLIERLINEAGAPMSLFDKVYEYYISEYDSNFLYKTTAYEGILDMLLELKEGGIRLGVFSNKPHNTVVSVAEALFGKGFFDVLRGNVDGRPTKPDPAVLFEILNEMNVKKENCVYVGDTSVDMKTGKNAGIFTIGVLWGFRDFEELKASGADLIVSRPNEILNFIKRQGK